MIPEVLGSLLHMYLAIQATDVLSPPNNLTHKALKGIKRDTILFPISDSLGDNVLRGDESDIEHRGEDAVMNECFICVYGIFVHSEVGEVIT